MRASQDVVCVPVPVMSAKSHADGWLPMAGMMTRARNDDGTLTGKRDKPSALSQTLAQAMDFSEARLEKIALLRAAILDGSYRISAADLADRMVVRLIAEGTVPGRG